MGIPPNRRSFLKGAAALATSTITPALAQTTKPRNTLERGFNLPDWAGRLDGQPPAQATLETLAHLGFNTVRLPVYPQHILGDDATARLRHIHAAITMLQESGYSVTLDMHLEDAFITALQNNPTQTGNQINTAWARLAKVLADLPADSTYAELLNEPPLEKSDWLVLRDQLAATVRNTCPKHTIIWGAARYQGIWETVDYAALPDTNTIAAVHYYWPLGFTHQCASWGDPAMAKLRNLPFPATRSAPQVAALRRSLEAEGDKSALALLDDAVGTDWTYDIIDQDFADLADWSKRTDTPIVINEFGVLNFCVDAESRQNWIGHVRRAAEQHNMSWTYWELDHGFGFMGNREDPDSIDYALVSTLLAG